MGVIGNMRLCFAFAAATMFFGASATPAKTAVFTGGGFRSARDARVRLRRRMRRLHTPGKRGSGTAMIGFVK